MPIHRAAARYRGFSLLELLVTLTVAAVLVTVGVPSFQQIVQNNRATAHTNDLVTALNLGRSEATRRGEAVIVCSSTDGAACAADDDWSTGWIVMVDSDDELLRSWPARAGGNGVLTANVNSVRFDARGTVAAAGTEFDVRLPDCSGDAAREVRVNVAGRVSVAREAC